MLVVGVAIAVGAGVISWLGYLIFLHVEAARHGPEVLKHIPGAVKVYRAAGALAWVEVVTALVKSRRGGAQ